MGNMGAGQGKNRRVQNLAVNGGVVPVFDLKRAVGNDKTGLAAEVIGVLHELDDSSATTAVIGDGMGIEAGAYTLKHSVAGGLEITSMLVDGRWNLGGHYMLRENGTWEVRAFSFNPDEEEEVRSRRHVPNASAPAKHLEKLKGDVRKITEACAWGEAQTHAEVLRDFNAEKLVTD
jgi:hypothetical protein